MTTLVISYRQTLLLAVWSVLLSLVLIGYFLLSATGKARDSMADPSDEGRHWTVAEELILPAHETAPSFQYQRLSFVLGVGEAKGDSLSEKWTALSTDP